VSVSPLPLRHVASPEAVRGERLRGAFGKRFEFSERHVAFVLVDQHLTVRGERRPPLEKISQCSLAARVGAGRGRLAGDHAG
jgi:hypothetical protein